MAATDQVKDPLVNETKEHASENKSEAPPAIEVNDPVKDNAEDKDTKIQTELPSKINVLSPLESSKKAKEGQKWNDRDPEWQDYTKNIKSDLTSQEQSDDPVAIRKQVEFYFSDSNLLVDKFLFSKVEGHANLPVPLSIIMSFKRMRHFQPLAAVVQALKESTFLNLVDNDSCLQRKIPLPQGLKDKPMHEISKVYEDQTMARSIYVKGFGEEKPGTQFDIEAFFADYGPTNSVRLRRTEDKTFKGSVFVEFDTETTQKAFLALDTKPKWKGVDLEIKSKKQYCDDKVEDIRQGRIQPNIYHRENKNKSRGDRQSGNNNDRDWRARREDDRKGGFRNKNDGRHRGFGSSGRSGRGDGRGRGERRGRGNDRPEHRRKDRDEHQVPKIGISASSQDEAPIPTSEHPSIPQATENNGLTVPNDPAQGAIISDAESKKRAREANDDAGDDTHASAKKIHFETEVAS